MPPRPGQRVVQEAFVPGDVDEADLEVVARQMREAQVDRDAALLLLAPAIAVDTGQRLDQRRLAVVDMAGSADDGVAHQLDSARTSRAIRLMVPPSVWPEKRASISFMIGPIGRRPGEPLGGDELAQRRPDDVFVQLGRHVVGQDLGLAPLLRRQLGTTALLVLLGRLLALLDRLAHELHEPGLVELAADGDLLVLHRAQQQPQRRHAVLVARF